MPTEERSTSVNTEKSNGEKLATGLGWFSIGLGAAELVAPGKVAHLIGLRSRENRKGLLRFYGLRELAAGVGILSQPRAAGWLWARVAGDAVDLASLGSSFKASDANRAKVTASTAAVLGVAALDLICAQQLSTNGGNGAARVTVPITQSVTIGRSPEELYAFWRDFNNLPSFMRHLESVQVTGDRQSHWKAKAPNGKTVEWDAEIVEDQPDRKISWRSLKGSDVDHSGSVTFSRAAGNRGTVVRVDVQYAPSGGALVAKAAKLLRAAPAQFIGDELRAFKCLMETGEVVQSDPSIHFGMHPGRPPAANEMTFASRA
ncbi:MAG TPA: SRPBCC family protein [Bryobacteraceae bacterium]|jgi:uncharacterized membrane protein|nr:SRPBCC family protein [Bryobacteraceae bacterium]